jgi:hypothetical protein
MRSSSRRSGAVAAASWFGALVALLAPLAAAGPASAKTTKYTLVGGGNNAPSFLPGAPREVLKVHATSAGSRVSGRLETQGNPPKAQNGQAATFNGHVTCMLVSDNGLRVVVGAYGTAKTSLMGKHKSLPGKYAQLLTLEFGSFGEPFGEPITYTFAVLGSEGEGLPSTSPPQCATASFAKQEDGLSGAFTLTAG